MADTTDPGTNTTNNEVMGYDALTQLMPELEALRADELQAITVDIRDAMNTVTGSLPEIREYAAEIQKALPEVDLAAINKLETCVYALNFANAEFLSTGEATSELQLAVEEGGKLRELLLTDANALAARGLVDATRLKQMQGSVGFNNLGTDLAILCAVLKESWPQIQNKTAVTTEEIEQALRLSQKIILGMGLRAQGPANIARATDLRLRAFTLLARNYDKVRRGVSFIRWDHGDTDKIAPSIYAGRGGRRKQPDEPVNPTPPVVVPPPPAPNPHPTPTNAKSADSTSASASAAAPGSPNAEPFLK